MQPLSDVKVTLLASFVQWCSSLVVFGVERGTCAVQPLNDVEVTTIAGDVQRCVSVGVSRIERGARAVQPLRDVEVALQARDPTSRDPCQVSAWPNLQRVTKQPHEFASRCMEM